MILSKKQVEQLKANRFDMEAWLEAEKTWCVVCGKFIEHYIDDWGNPGPAFFCSLEVGGWYCSHHILKAKVVEVNFKV